MKPLKIIILGIFSIFQNVCSERILFVLPLATRSEPNLFTPLAKALHSRGHGITFISPVPSGIQLNNFTEINPPQSPFELEDFYPNHTPLEVREQVKSISNWITADFTFILNGCHAVYKDPGFQKIYKETFDLIIISGNFNECFFGLVHKFQVPFIVYHSMPLLNDLAKMTGLRMPDSFVPHSMMEYTDRMTFGERIGNTLINALFTVLHHTVANSISTEIYRGYLGADVPDLLSIERNVSLLFGNSHFSLNSPRPVLPDIVEIGGIHCRDPFPLPQELDNWLSEAKDGFIYFSFGTVVRATSLSAETRQIFLNVFGRLKQRVLWKWEEDTMPNLPGNVKLGKWLPQQDILGHKNIKLLISHGGLLGTQEATFHGVPVLGFPFAADQDVNMKQMQEKGVSIMMEVLDITEDKLEAAIRQLIDNPMYMKRAKQLSKIVRDRPETPLQTAVFWTEYVLRHNGASHLRSVARDLNIIQYYSLDVIAFLISALFLAIYAIIKIFTLCCKSKKIKTYSANKKHQ